MGDEMGVCCLFRYGDDAHLDTTVQALGLVMPNKVSDQDDVVNHPLVPMIVDQLLIQSMSCGLVGSCLYRNSLSSST